LQLPRGYLQSVCLREEDRTISPYASIALGGGERGLRVEAAELVSMKTELNDIMTSLVHCRPDSLHRSEIGAFAAAGGGGGG